MVSPRSLFELLMSVLRLGEHRATWPACGGLYIHVRCVLAPLALARAVRTSRRHRTGCSRQSARKNKNRRASPADALRGLVRLPCAPPPPHHARSDVRKEDTVALTGGSPAHCPARSELCMRLPTPLPESSLGPWPSTVQGPLPRGHQACVTCCMNRGEVTL